MNTRYIFILLISTGFNGGILSRTFLVPGLDEVPKNTPNRMGCTCADGTPCAGPGAQCRDRSPCCEAVSIAQTS